MKLTLGRQSGTRVALHPGYLATPDHGTVRDAETVAWH